MMDDLKHLGLPRRRRRPDWILGIAAGVIFLALLSWMANRDAEYRRDNSARQSHIVPLSSECPETPLQERAP